ncbi:MAG TPA: dipeptidase [Flavobacteriaceae bacterium]|nr:dipeptidase [Flavobacteriaceae bacterium]
MKRIYLIAFTLIFSNSIAQTKEADEAILEEAKRIHENVITIDTHCDINIANFTSNRNYTQDTPSQVNLPKMVKGGLDVAWFIVYTGQGPLNEVGYASAYEQAMSKFDAIHRLALEYAPNQIELALTSKDVRRIHAAGKKVAMIGVENGYPIGTDVSRVKEFYDLGARYMSLAHNGHSQLSDSNTGEGDDVWLHDGLSDLGKEVLAEMNKYGMMLDVSHPSKEAMRDMIELSKAPIIASHSSARALCDHSRNLDDEQLQWIKENNGVVQAVAFASYIDTKKANAFIYKINQLQEKEAEKVGFEILSYYDVQELPTQEREEYRKNYLALQKRIKPKVDALYKNEDPVNVADFVDHIDYMVKKIGVEHVGISSDFDGGGGIYGWNDASETVNVTLELVKRGYTEEEIKLLWGDNLLRVLDDVQKVAQEIQRK